MSRIDDLLKKGYAKLSVAEMKELSNALDVEAQQKEKGEFEGKFNQVVALIDELGLDKAKVAERLKNPPVLIFKWKDKTGTTHERYTGEIGRYPEWVSTLKSEVPDQEEAKKFAVTDAGKTFITNLYKAK